MTEAQTEMQTLRSRLTVAESKLAEKTVEIDKIMEENRAMKESMDRINNHQILKPEASKSIINKECAKKIKCLRIKDKLNDYYLFLP